MPLCCTLQRTHTHKNVATVSLCSLIAVQQHVCFALQFPVVCCCSSCFLFFVVVFFLQGLFFVMVFFCICTTLLFLVASFVFHTFALGLLFCSFFAKMFSRVGLFCPFARTFLKCSALSFRFYYNQNAKSHLQRRT